ncbi:MAG: hypothetical protein BA865_00915 [Desulfobacterales bacterium S5133MH4]|nr:MAG: hypothetical protein BA865_00915 [Desulfobacterales bacterium S5133MH4]
MSCQEPAIRPIKALRVPPFNEVKAGMDMTTLEKMVNRGSFNMFTDPYSHRNNAKTKINSIPARLVMKTTHPVFSIIVFLPQAVKKVWPVQI